VLVNAWNKLRPLLLASVCATAWLVDAQQHRAVLGEIRQLGGGITPGIAADSEGNLHMIYMESGRILYLRRNSRGTLDGPEVVPSPDGGGPCNSPHVVADRHGVPHVVFQREFSSRSKTAWYSNRLNGYWKKPVAVLSVEQGRVNYPRLALTETAAFVGGFTAGHFSNGMVAKVIYHHATPQVAKTIATELWVPTPLVTSDGRLLLFGRAGARGHALRPYDLDLVALGESILMSAGTRLKTGEPAAAVIDKMDVAHVAGVCGFIDELGATRDQLWYNNSARAEAGRGVILGIRFSATVDEWVYPSMALENADLLHLAYRDHDTGEGRLTTIAEESFKPPVTFAPAVAKRLRWSPQIAAAQDGLHAVWECGGAVFLRNLSGLSREP
jgi:hypothetical protein